ncbi:MAG: sulfotransferase [Leptolyngbya sp. SIO1D8]|nr:sulfotransferase [Leptolyngbya sp. SIO1D8]
MGIVNTTTHASNNYSITVFTYQRRTSVVSHKPIKLIYIVGNGHSGSTLLDLALGSHSQIESGGEMFRFAEYFSPTSDRPARKRICTCGANVENCPYWQSVKQQLDPIHTQIDLDINTKNLTAFEKRNFNLISAMLKTSGKTMFCDSSKEFSRLRRFLKSKLFDVTVVHLVRDGRAVSFSIQKKAARKAGKPDSWKEYRYTYFQYLKDWKVRNTKIHRKLNSDPRYLCVRYEDFVSDPQAKLTEIINRSGLQFERQQLAFWEFSHHNLNGSSWRKQMKPDTPQPIQRDVSYLKNLTCGQWWMSNIFAFLTLQKYNYSLTKE